MTYSPRALITGWFTFDEVIATVGDLLGGEVTERWLRAAGWDCDVAVAPYMGYGVDWRTVDPGDYDVLVFTTGPLHPSSHLTALLDRFEACRRWAINVSIIDDALRARFERVWERDSPALTRPDLAFAAVPAYQPVVAVAYVPEQPEYGGSAHVSVQDTIHDWVAGSQLAAFELDMDMYAEHRFPRRPGQIESLIARADVVVSMRLHATVLALRQGKPVVAVDAIPGGGKLSRQARSVQWPALIPGEHCTPGSLDRALQWCLSDEAPGAVARSTGLAAAAMAQLADGFAEAASADTRVPGGASSR